MSPLPPKQPVPEELTERLKAAGIWQMVDSTCYGVFVRDGCMVVAQREPVSGAFTSVGSVASNVPGVGMAYLQWQDNQPFLYRKEFGLTPASEEQLAAIRQFSIDVRHALRLEEPADEAAPGASA